MKNSWLGIVVIIYLYSIYFLSYQIDQASFHSIFFGFALAFLTFVICCKSYFKMKFKNWIWLIILANLIPLFSSPNLSPDVYRFIWDGDIMLQGINPFSYSPNDLVSQECFQWTERLQKVYLEGMTDLSIKNFSVYPTLNQCYFYVCSFFTNDIFSFFIVMRLLMMGTHILGFLFIIKLLDLLSISRSRTLLIALNPLVIIELMGNFHFEGVMMSFLVIALYYVLKKQLFKSTLFWSFAVNIKLTPLLLLPFSWKYLGLKHSIKFYFLTFLFSIFLLLLIIWPALFHHFWESVKLYFSNFEFNSSGFRFLSWIFHERLGGQAIPVLGPILSMISLFLILLFAFFIPKKDAMNMFIWMLFAYVVYLLLSTTVHPWYIVVPLVISLFTKYNFVVLWSFLTTWSYELYSNDISLVGITTWSYYILIGYLFYEIFQKKIHLKWLKYR